MVSMNSVLTNAVVWIVPFEESEQAADSVDLRATIHCDALGRPTATIHELDSSICQRV